MKSQFLTGTLLPLICLCTLAGLLTGSSSCQTSDDADGDGYTTDDGDCDDQDPSVYPGAFEKCDGRDNDCDTQIDEGLNTLWYLDQDGDGFGATPVPALPPGCLQPAGSSASGGDCDDTDASVHAGALEVCDADVSDHPDNDCDARIDEGFITTRYPDRDSDGFGDSSEPVSGCQALAGCVAARGDCQDGDSSIHPGAADPAEDGVDRDCGGTDAADPHVGLSSTSMTTLQAALDAATPGSTIWVGPGTWLEHDLDFKGKAVTLSSTEGPYRTVIDAKQGGRVLQVVSGETRATVVDGFTLQGGASDRQQPGARGEHRRGEHGQRQGGPA